VPVAPKRQRKAVEKQSGKKAKKAPVLVHMTLTSTVKPAQAKATPSEEAKAQETEDAVDLLESSDEFEDLPRVKG
jgi:hypothetical protein